MVVNSPPARKLTSRRIGCAARSEMITTASSNGQKADAMASGSSSFMRDQPPGRRVAAGDPPGELEHH